MRKQIDLPNSIIKELKLQASGERMKVKPFMEKILIDQANAKSYKPLKSKAK